MFTLYIGILLWETKYFEMVIDGTVLNDKE